MLIKTNEIQYKHGLPFEAELSVIGNQYPHRHNTELELVYCLKGEIHLIASDQDYIISAGQIHSIDFRDIHFLSGSDDNLTLTFHLDLSSLSNWEELKYVFFACESNHCFPYQKPALDRVKDIVLALSYIYFLDNTDYEDSCKASVEELGRTLLQYFNWFNYENNDEYMNQELYDRANRILIYIAENYKKKISVSHLAAREHINKNYFSQFISKTVFSSFSNIVNYVRCYNAESLLLTTDMSISEISFECGFSDPKYFYRAFKSLWNMTPTENRERYRLQCENAIKSKSSTTIEGSAATVLLKDYITLWHLEKALNL